jgi:hypothetical protein
MFLCKFFISVSSSFDSFELTDVTVSKGRERLFLRGFAQRWILDPGRRVGRRRPGHRRIGENACHDDSPEISIPPATLSASLRGRAYVGKREGGYASGKGRIEVDAMAAVLPLLNTGVE